MNNCCVYFHKDIFHAVKYVGSGSVKRAYRSNCRSKAWNALFKDNRPIVEIVEYGLSKEESIELEQKLVLKHASTVINCRKPFLPTDKSFDEVSKVLYVDCTSPSGLRWKVPSGRYGRYPEGSPAGALGGHRGFKYWSVNLKGKSVGANRLVYLLTHGNIGRDLVVNHIDGNTTNNAPSNLEMITQSSNTFKRKKTPSSFTDGLSFKIVKGKYTFAVMSVSVNNKEYKKSFGVMTHGLMESVCKLIEFRKRILTEHNVE